MQEQISNHPIWASINQLKELRGDAAFVDSAGDEQTFWLSQRIFQFVTVLEQRLRHTPTTLLSANVLNQLNSVLSSATTEVRNFVTNKNVGHLTNAINQIESSGYKYLAQLPVSQSGDDVGKIVDDLNGQVQGILKAALLDRERLQKQVAQLVEQVDQVSGRVQGLTEAVAQQQAEAMNVVKAVQTQYAAKEQELTASFSAAQSERAREHTEMLKRHDDATAKDREAAETAQAELIAALEQHRAHAAELVGIIGNIGATGNYQKVAASEGRAANRWRWITVGGFGVAIAVGSAALFTAHDVGLPLTIARMLFAFLVLGVTVYTGKESARHRSNADRAKRVELELASLGPFIESLPSAQQQAVREKLTLEYFGKQDEPHNVESPLDVNKLLRLLRYAIGKVSR